MSCTMKPLCKYQVRPALPSEVVAACGPQEMHLYVVSNMVCISFFDNLYNLRNWRKQNFLFLGPLLSITYLYSTKSAQIVNLLRICLLFHGLRGSGSHNITSSYISVISLPVYPWGLCPGHKNVDFSLASLWIFSKFFNCYFIISNGSLVVFFDLSDPTPGLWRHQQLVLVLTQQRSGATKQQFFYPAAKSQFKVSFIPEPTLEVLWLKRGQSAQQIWYESIQRRST